MPHTLQTAEIVIEQPTFADVESIAVLRASYWQEAAQAHNSETIPYRYLLDGQRDQAEFKLRDPDAYVRVARVGERIVGLVTGSLASDKGFPSAYVGLLIVAPDFRGQGLGSDLLNGYEAAVPTALPIRLSPYGPDDEALERFYGRHGYEWLEEDEDYMIKRREQ